MNLYNTDVKNLICSCEDWKQTRRDYPLDDPRRLCKHIINKLDIKNLPTTIKVFQEDIKFYKEKEKGYTQEFEKVIEFPINNLIVLINSYWMNVYDRDANRYGYLNDEYTGSHWWTEGKKPDGYEEIETFFKNKYDTKLIDFRGNEKSNLINFIKKNIPSKQGVSFSFDKGYSESFGDTYIYYLEETKKLVTYYEDNEEYKINFVSMDKYYITVHMKNGSSFSYKRDYEYAKKLEEKIKQLKESGELKQRLEREKQERLWKEEREQKRKIAKEKGYLWEIKDTLYREAITFCNLNHDSQYTKYLKSKENISLDYENTKKLLEVPKNNIISTQFHTALKNMNMVTKVKGLNLNDWILIGEGLNFGINIEKDSQYFSETVPSWYKITTLHPSKLVLVDLIDKQNVRMTRILWNKDKFENLIHLIKEQIEIDKNKKSPKQLRAIKKHEEREKWLNNVSCPNCDSKNIHKKDKRQRKNYKVQRYQCMDCKSVFQKIIDENYIENINDLENDIKDIKFDFTSYISSFIKKFRN